MDLAKRKNWLREECGWILYQAIRSLQADKQDPKYSQLIIDKLHSNGLTRTPEGVAVWVAVREVKGHVKLPKGIWQNENPLHPKEKASLATILREASKNHADQSEADSKASQKGSWTSKLHFSWEIIMKHILDPHPPHHTKEIKEINMVTFWDECVDSMIAARASNKTC